MILAEAIRQARALDEERDSPSRRERAIRLLRLFLVETATAKNPQQMARSIVAQLTEPEAVLL